MNLKNKSILFSTLVIIFSLVFSFTCIADQENVQTNIKQIMDRQQEVKNFKTDAKLNIKFSGKQNSSFNFTYYYHEPDLVHLETTDFVLLPTEPLQSLQPSFFKLDNYQLDFKGIEQKDLAHFLLTPHSNKEKFWIEIWINTVENNIDKAEVYFTIPTYDKTFSLNVHYQQINGYSMPATIKGKIAIPAKFSKNGSIKKFHEGYFDLKLDNYKINQGFSPKIMKKLTG